MEELMGIGVVIIMVLVSMIYKKNRGSDSSSNIRYQISRD